MQWVRLTSIIENNNLIVGDFLSWPLSLTLPSLTLETISGTRKLKGICFWRKGRSKNLCSASLGDSVFEWNGVGVWVLGSDCFASWRKDTRPKDMRISLKKKKNLFLPLLLPLPSSLFLVFSFIENAFHLKCGSRCGHLLPVSQVSSGILVT